MKFTFDREALAKEITVAQEIIAIKNSASILSNVLLIAENNTLTIKATDTKVTFETRIPVNVEEEGSTTVYCDKLMGILSSLPNGEIEFIQENTNDDSAIAVIIKPIAKKIKFQMRSMTTEKFPVFDSAENVPYFEISAKDFKEMIAQTQFAVSDDEQRIYLNGVNFDKNENTLTLVATNSRLLSLNKKEIDANIPDFPAALVPPKVLGIVAKRAPSEGMISIAVVDKMIFFKFANYQLSSVLIDAQFPNYKRVIPENQPYKFEVEKADFVDALKRVALMVDKKLGKIFFDIAPGVLRITSTESELGYADEEIPCQYDGDAVKMAFNYRYIDEPLHSMDSDRIVIEFSEPMRAITMHPQTEASYFHVIMPLQID